MKNKIFIGLSIVTALSFTACSNKIPDAQAVKWHKNSALTINKEFLLTKDFKVPKDPHLKNENWTFQAVAEKSGKYLFKDLIKEYKNYFLENQVTAEIKLQEVNPLSKDYDKVNILFFNGIN